jgi:putative FmdB family regulatory protein
MPTYEYQCKACGHQLEEFQSITEPALTKCPACGGETLTRILGSGAGLIFKGSGFYLTDYKKTSAEPSSPDRESGKGKATKDGPKPSPSEPDTKPPGGGSKPDPPAA